MFAGLRQIRPGERRDTAVAGASLFAIMAGHAILETSRDALFLARIDPARLPFVYIGVAVAALAVATLQDRGPSGRAALAGWLAISGLVTGGFYFLIQSGEWVLYALYIWSAVVATVALTRFFILLGERFTASQAKRLYSVIGVGSVFGAIVGSGLAGLLSTIIAPNALLLVGAGVLALSAIGPLALTPAPGGPGESLDAKNERPSPAQSAKTVLAHPYARRVALFIVLATLTFTLVDFVFKSAVARNVATEDLGFFFARVYFVLNIASLVVQLTVVRWTIRVAGPTRSLALLSGLLVLGGLGVLFGGGLAAGVALKGADGSLRHSLHRTASELLYVPMSSRLRNASKTFIEIAGHRGGQAIASLLILAIAATGVSPDYVGAAIFVLAGAAFAVALELRRHYLDVFRGTLAETAEHKHYAFPELSLATLESLLATLNSPDARRVVVALELFAEQGRARLIPALILYHPSPDVLAKALEVLAGTRRLDFLPLADRLLDHEYADVRAAALRARMALAPDETLLRQRIEASCPVVRTTALVGLAAGNFATLEETRPYLDEVVERGSNIAKAALARAIGYGPAIVHDEYLLRLAQSDDDDVLLAVARSMGVNPSVKFVPELVRMLAHRSVRDAAQKSLIALGEAALVELEATLTDEDHDVGVRRQIPRTIAMFDPSRAMSILTSNLARVRDGGVRYRILRALNRVVSENPDMRIDRKVLFDALDDTVARAYQLLDWRLTMERGGAKDETRRTTSHQLLVKMLRDKEENTRGRLFQLLGTLHPHQDLPMIVRGLKSARGDVKSSSRELLESFVSPRLSDAVLGLVDDLPDDQRLLSSGGFHRPSSLGYIELLQKLLEIDSDSLRILAVYHLSELGIGQPTARVDVLRPVEAVNAR